ncbi:cytochrome P450 [Crucibulum laeve]|uniref:Cytochrome P450 n=1 Tax=Crucibulum laeve TaxID=68775 RepID=A0A5C3LUR3_9AGAR|nr:cytochrome P450 [Crucibulum laeve]
MNISISDGLVVAVVLLSMAFVRFRQQGRGKGQNGHKLPPGPSRIPIFGNLLQVPVLRPYPKFKEWAKQYGSVFSLKLGPQNVIVLNSAEAADELLTNRSKNYSSRAPPHVAHDIMSAGQRLVFLPYDKEWKVARKTLQHALGPGPSKQLRSVQELESRVVIWDLMTHADKSLSPELAISASEVPEAHWFSLIRRYTTSVVMTATYGNRVNRYLNNPHLHKIYDVLANFAHVGQPGKYLADAFPIFRKLPDILAPWRVEGRKMHEWEMELWGGLLDKMKSAMRKGEYNSSYVSKYLKERAEHGIEEAPGIGLTDDGWLKDVLLAYTAGTVLEAGSDTTASTMQSFILFMLSHPHVLERVRKEVDSVVGEDRLPEWEDEKDMPYLIACIKETLRRRPPTIMGIPHLADEDDVYEGHFIPKGSTIIGNVWAIHMDPIKYPNPTAYQPERFLMEDGKMRWGSGPESRDRDHYVFGWGRRFCQGSHIAEASLFIVLARLLWALEFTVPNDPASGKPLIPDISDEEGTFTTGFVSIPKTFPVAFRPRSEKKQMMVQKAFEDAQAEWEVRGFDKDER